KTPKTDERDHERGEGRDLEQPERGLAAREIERMKDELRAPFIVDPGAPLPGPGKGFGERNRAMRDDGAPGGQMKRKIRVGVRRHAEHAAGQDAQEKGPMWNLRRKNRERWKRPNH